jgi:hypothetical protein
VAALAPPQGALVLAREAGVLAVALAVLPQRLEVTVVAPSGDAATKLGVSIDGSPATGCGPGCYAVAHGAGRRVLVRVGKRAVPFTVPSHTKPAGALLLAAGRAFRNLQSVEYVERLASSPTRRIVTRWREQAPHQLAYEIRGGAEAVLIGRRRWDRSTAGTWRRSRVSPLRLPEPVWGATIADARLLSETPRVAVVSWANPAIPAWFTARFDRRTLHPLELQMTAAAHFMHHRYVSFNRPLGIRPPS